MDDSPAPRWWRRRRDLALASARQAQGQAAVALLELDTAQRSAFSHLDFLADVDAGPTGRRIRLAWAPVTAAADAAVHAYLGALEQHDVTTDLELEQAAAAASAFAGHRDAMRSVVAEIDAFRERFTPDFVNVTRTLDELVARRTAAESAVQDARRQLVRAEQEGLRPRRARALLEAADGHLRTVQAGPVVHGMQRVLLACGDAVAAAHEAAHDVEGLPALRGQVTTGLASLRTRLEGVQWRGEQGSEQVLRELRRRFAHDCWRDLEDGARQAADALAAARSSYDEAVTAAGDDEQRWDDALTALARTRQALGRAEAHLDGPRDRLQLLQDVSSDPAAVHARARFAVREAQKLLMSGPVDARQASVLDALAARLDAVQALLERPHPNWFAYAHALDAIVDAAHGLVVDIRASRAR